MQRYPKEMVERMMTYFKWEGVITPESLVRDINNKLLSLEKDVKKRFCFDLFDVNQDGRICVKDVYTLMDLLYDKDNVLQNDAFVMTQVPLGVHHLISGLSPRRKATRIC